MSLQDPEREESYLVAQIRRFKEDIQSATDNVANRLRNELNNVEVSLQRRTGETAKKLATLRELIKDAEARQEENRDLINELHDKIDNGIEKYVGASDAKIKRLQEKHNTWIQTKDDELMMAKRDIQRLESEKSKLKQDLAESKRLAEQCQRSIRDLAYKVSEAQNISARCFALESRQKTIFAGVVAVCRMIHARETIPDFMIQQLTNNVGQPLSEELRRSGNLVSNNTAISFASSHREGTTGPTIASRSAQRNGLSTPHDTDNNRL
ncbi:hypothetical protein CVT24_007403 [Panaeolus cyanescens]|uniref:Uncharacterized protein n=1 Tax=Panaeolus cyanescens TaxID=181874 RepID=A0A409W9V1_9AGAR|nr:hypothetical protein CVT24_007403 [Panaeolus cyanescens]